MNLDADVGLIDDSEQIRGARRFCAVLWAFVLAFALAATVFQDPRGLALCFIAAVVTSFLTVGMCKLTRDERLARPAMYRVTSAVLLGAALCGIAIAFVPRGSDTSRVTAVFFGIAAFLAYRCVVTRGPAAALWTVVLAMWTWIPFVFVTLVGCGRYRRVPHWTEIASLQSMRVVLLLLPVLAIAALVSFTPRRDHMPDARVITRQAAAR